MPRVLGIDPGTVSIDVCGLDEGVLFLDRSFPTADVLADPDRLVAIVRDAGPLDLVAGPSGYGLPLVAGAGIRAEDLRLACLAAEGEPGGIRGLRRLMRQLAGLPVPVVFTPGVVHLPTVPAWRKVNRVDMGTADKVCAAVLALHERTRDTGQDAHDVAFILVELGGAFTSALAIEGGAIVDGVGGTSGPMGLRAAGALDGEVAFLAGAVTKRHLFGGGAADVAGMADLDADRLAAAEAPRLHLAREAYLESVVKAVAALRVSAPGAREIVLSGRGAAPAAMRAELTRRVAAAVPGAQVSWLTGFAPVAKAGAQGAAILADGLAGGRAAGLVDALGIRGAAGTVLDHLHIVAHGAARARIGLD